jgi:hypothetical protein
MRGRQSQTSAYTLREKIIVRHFARRNSWLFAGEDPELHPTSVYKDMELKTEAEQKMLHRMAKVDDCWEMSQGSQNLQAIQKQFFTQNKQMTAIEHISVTEEIIKAFWLLIPHNDAAAFKLLEKSPMLASLSAKDIPGVRTEILNVGRIKQIDRHPATCNEDSLLERISDPENLLDWNRDLDNRNDSEDDWEADNYSDMELDNSSED